MLADHPQAITAVEMPAAVIPAVAVEPATSGLTAPASTTVSLLQRAAAAAATTAAAPRSRVATEAELTEAQATSAAHRQATREPAAPSPEGASAMEAVVSQEYLVQAEMAI